MIRPIRRRVGPSTLTLALVLVAAASAGPLGFVACGSTVGGAGGAGNGGGGSGGTGNQGGGGDGGLFVDGGPGIGITLTPIDPILAVQVPVVGQTLDFECMDNATGQPAVNPTWGLSVPDLGSIDQNGTFTPNGLKMGQVKVSCTHGLYTAETTLTVTLKAVDNPGALTQQQIDLLKGPPGQSDPQWKFVYPYDKTIFPRGIPAPEIHLSTGNSPGNAYYVHVVTQSGFEYEGYFSSQPAAVLAMSQAAWDAMTYSAGGEEVQVYVSKISNNVKYGPIFRTWKLAPGTLHGTVYYNTYDTLPNNPTQGAVVRLKGNSINPEVVLGNCHVCHSVSSDGSTGASGEHGGTGGIFDFSGGQIPPPSLYSATTETAFAALYPDGSVFVTNATPSYSLPGMGGGVASVLKTKNGTTIANSGIEPFYAMSPVFSHDGKFLAFTDRPQNGTDDVLALFEYDAAAQKFTNYQVLAVPQANRYFGWPAFTPDNRYVLVQNGGAQDLMTWGGDMAKLFAIDLQNNNQLIALGKLNGDGYVPQGARDEGKNYEPTTTPVASGGYFWVMFTSRRTYGNTLTGDPSQTKRLWAAAIDINAPSGVDPSHPAFFVAGQSATGNSRGFWALDPCKADGNDCASGDECCSGFCNPTGDPPMFKCGPPDGECSAEFEFCDTAADCCDPGAVCINNKCAIVPN